MTAPVLDRATDQSAPERVALDAAQRLAAYVAGTAHAEVDLTRTECTHPETGAHASVPVLGRDGSAVGIVCALDERPRELSAVQIDLLRDVAAQVSALVELRRATRALTRVSSRDELTGLANRRTAEQAIAAAIARAERGLGTPSVVVVDLDGFGQINELHGHAAGDDVVRSAADRLVRCSRAVDTVGRLGGDDFVVLLESTGGPGATAALGRLRHSLEDGWAEVLPEPAQVRAPVRASLGITTYRPGDSVASLLARADAEMYADKTRHGTYPG